MKTVEEVRRLRLQQLVAEAGGSLAALNRATGKTSRDATYSQILNEAPDSKTGRPRAMGSPLARDLEVRLDKPRGWMDTPHEAEEQMMSTVAATPPSGYVRLEHLSPQPSMGRGATISEPEYVVQYLDVLEQWVCQHVGRMDPARIKILTGNGNSMLPTIQDKDLVFVDIGCHTIETEGIYVLDVVGRLLIKKALILLDGTLIIRSDNVVEYPDEERYNLRHMDESDIVVCGKVLAWWTLKKG